MKAEVRVSVPFFQYSAREQIFQVWDGEAIADAAESMRTCVELAGLFRLTFRHVERTHSRAARCGDVYSSSRGISV